MREEIREGFVVDLHCLRSWPQREYLQRAKDHSITCSLRGIESGYALIDDGAMLLDAAATPMVIHALRESNKERGVRIRVVRRPNHDRMETAVLDLAISRENIASSNVLSIGYDDRILEVEFKNGIYQYLDVPEAIYRAFKAAPSKGRYFNNYIKRRFMSRKVV